MYFMYEFYTWVKNVWKILFPLRTSYIHLCLINLWKYSQIYSIRYFGIYIFDPFPIQNWTFYISSVCNWYILYIIYDWSPRVTRHSPSSKFIVIHVKTLLYFFFRNHCIVYRCFPQLFKSNILVVVGSNGVCNI